MAKNQSQVSLPDDIWAAIALLSRLPVPPHSPRGANAAWAYPIAGAVIGCVTLILGWLAIAILDLPTAIVAIVVAVTPTILTGGLHEDGLADCADGFWGGHTAEKRLAIMKDSLLGSYGVMALIFVLLTRYVAVMLLLGSEAGLLWLIGVAALSRLPMIIMMRELPNARGSGLSASVGVPSQLAIGQATLAAGLIGLLTLQFSLFLCIIWGVIAATGSGLIASRKIGGQTGDVLGATQQITELGLLIALTIYWL